MRLATRPAGSPRNRGRAVLTAALCGTVLATTVACGGGSTVEQAAADETVPAATPSAATSGPPLPAAVAAPLDDGVLSFVVVGDSLTAAPVPLDEIRYPGTGSWVGTAQGDPLEFRGGWAVPGATTADMLAGVQHEDAEVLVVLAGTNNLSRGIPWETTEAELRAIVAKVGVAEVLLSAIPPLDSHPAEAVAHNGHLATLAQQQGWAFTDPWTEVRLPDGTFVPGVSDDGTHPSSEVADAVGLRIRDALLTGAGA